MTGERKAGSLCRRSRLKKYGRKNPREVQGSSCTASGGDGERRRRPSHRPAPQNPPRWSRHLRLRRLRGARLRHSHPVSPSRAPVDPQSPLLPSRQLPARRSRGRPRRAVAVRSRERGEGARRHHPDLHRVPLPHLPGWMFIPKPLFSSQEPIRFLSREILTSICVCLLHHHQVAISLYRSTESS